VRETLVASTSVNALQQFHTSSGLTINQYELKSMPEVDPIQFAPVTGTQDEILAIHAAERAAWFPDNSFFENSLFSRKASLGNKTLIAQEGFSDSQTDTFHKVSVTVSLDKKAIYTIDAGDASPIQALQGLWTYADHWLLEIAHVTATLNSKENSESLSTFGKLVQDGELLNDKYGYQEAFGSQLINGKPFYFFKKDGKFSISYDGQTTELGYDEIPHYGCCSAAETNPQPAQEMVSFFAHKKSTWYYVEIGTFQ
jgi:hypothetical protein